MAAAAAPKKFSNNIEVFQYIGTLAERTKVDISMWNIPEIFVGENLQTLVLDPQEINKRFFERLEKAWGKKSEEPAPKLLISDEDLATLSKKFQSPAVAKLQKSVEYQKSRADEFERSIKNYQDALDKTKAEMARLTEEWEKAKKDAKPNEFRQALEDFTRAGFYTDFKWHGGFLWCLTRNIFMKSPTTKQNIFLGRYALRINLTSFTVSVFPYENNKSGSHHGNKEWHPFGADAGGNFCAVFHDNSERTIYSVLHAYAAILESPDGTLHWSPERGVEEPEAKHEYYPK